MAGEETLVSRALTPLLNDASSLSVVASVGALLLAVGILVPQVPTWAASLLVGGYVFLNRGKLYAEENDLRKNGVYRTTEDVVDNSSIISKYYREGYSVFYIAGYEIFRKRDFRLETDENGNLKEIDIDREVEKQVDRYERNGSRLGVVER